MQSIERLKNMSCLDYSRICNGRLSKLVVWAKYQQHLKCAGPYSHCIFLGCWVYCCANHKQYPVTSGGKHLCVLTFPILCLEIKWICDVADPCKIRCITGSVTWRNRNFSCWTGWIGVVLTYATVGSTLRKRCMPMTLTPPPGNGGYCLHEYC